MNLREALEVVRAAERKGLPRDLLEYLLCVDLNEAFLSFDEVDLLESLGVYCWYVKGPDGMASQEPAMHYYSIGGSK